MRFIITAQSSTEKETTEQQSDFDVELFKAYMRFNEEMHQAGVLVASEGLNPSAPGARVAVADGKRHVVDGPFAESKELVGGFYLIEVSSLDEAIQWALRAPSGFGKDDILEIRQLTGAGDLPPEILQLINEVAPTWSASVWQSRKPISHTTSTNKQFLASVFAETAKGNGKPFVEALADDVEWKIIGTTSWSRTYVGKAAVLKELLGPLNSQFAGGNTIIAQRILGEDDYVVVEARGRNRTKAGQAYENEYCWVIMMRDGKMTRIVEYADTALIESALIPLPDR